MSQIDLVRIYVENMRAIVDGLEIYPRSSDSYRFDLVALGLVSKAFGFCDACLTLIDNKFVDEAYGLSRSLVECAATLRYLTMNPKMRDARTRVYVDYFYAERIYWLAQSRAYMSSPRIKEEIEKFALEKRLEDLKIDPKDAVRHWSKLAGFMWKVTEMEHPLDDPEKTLAFRRRAYAVDYHATSQYVHCSSLGISNYWPNFLEPYTARCQSERYVQNIQLVLFILVMYLHSCCAYGLFGLGIDLPLQLDHLLSAMQDRLEVPELTSTANAY